MKPLSVQPSLLYICAAASSENSCDVNSLNGWDTCFRLSRNFATLHLLDWLTSPSLVGATPVDGRQVD